MPVLLGSPALISNWAADLICFFVFSKAIFISFKMDTSVLAHLPVLCLWQKMWNDSLIEKQNCTRSNVCKFSFSNSALELTPLDTNGKTISK